MFLFVRATCEDIYNWQLIHNFYESPATLSEAINTMNPIMKIINPQLFRDIAIPIGWIDAQYELRPGYIDLGNSDALHLTEAITIEGWFNHNSRGGLVSKGGAFEDDGYGFTIGFGDGKFRFELQNTSLKINRMLL